MWLWLTWHNGTVANQETESEIQEPPEVDEKLQNGPLKEEKYLYPIQIAIIKESPKSFNISHNVCPD